jgi:hypothetical protein
MELTPLFANLMDYYVVIRLCKPYILKCICYVGVAHVRNISELLQHVFEQRFHGSNLYGDTSIIENIDKKVVQCVRIPLTDTIPPLLEFTESISSEPNQEQEYYDYFSHKDRQVPVFRFGFHTDRPSHKSHKNKLVLWNGQHEESGVKQQLGRLFTKYGIQVDVTNPHEAKKAFRSLGTMLHPDKIPLSSKDRDEKISDFKTFIQLFQELGYKGMKYRNKTRRTRNKKNRNDGRLSCRNHY